MIVYTNLRYVFVLLSLMMFIQLNAYKFVEPDCSILIEKIQEEDNLQILYEKEGFAEGTLVKTLEGYSPIECLMVGSFIMGYDPIEGYVPRAILGIEKRLLSEYISIQVDDDFLYVAPNQKLYVAENSSWIDAQDINPSYALLVNLIKDYSIHGVKLIEKQLEVYCLSVEGQNFFVTINDILVHNLDYNSAIVNTENFLDKAATFIKIGCVIIKHPYMYLIASAVHFAQACIKLEKQRAMVGPLRFSASQYRQPERELYQKVKADMSKIYKELIIVKQDLEGILKKQFSYDLTLSKALLNSIKTQLRQNIDTLLEISDYQELYCDDLTREKLRQLRQTELDQIESQIVEVVISLAFHFNELIDSRNKAYREFEKMFPAMSEFVYNGSGKKATIADCENVYIIEDMIKALENKNEELKIALAFYKKARHMSTLKQLTNIDVIIKEEESRIVEFDNFISNKTKLNNKNKLILESTFSRGYNIASLRSNAQQKIKKQRESLIAQEIRQAEQKKLEIKPPDHKDPKKDDDFFTEIKALSNKKARHPRFGKFYRDSKTGLWWSKDNAHHGGSQYKVFTERATGIEWTFDADELGAVITGKHKGPIGLFIPYNELIFL